MCRSCFIVAAPNSSIQERSSTSWCIRNLSGSYKLVHYMWASERDDISTFIKNPKVIGHLSDREYEMIDKASMPTVSVDHIQQAQGQDFELDLPLAATTMLLTLLIKI